MMNAFDLIIFDCDGVLVDSEEIATEVLAEILSGHGINMSAAEARAAFIGQSVQDIRLAAHRLTGILMPEDWSVAFYAALLVALEGRVRPVDGVVPVVEMLRELGISFCVASQGPIEKMRTTLTSAGLWDAFADRIFSAKWVARPKPAPDLFLHAAEVCGAKPGRTAVIEDSVPGVLAGVAAGMIVFAYCPPDRSAEMRALGAIPFHAMADLSRLLDIK
jgi:HAD superfamily hydrolase (TIGR01509 family)